MREHFQCPLADSRLQSLHSPKYLLSSFEWGSCPMCSVFLPLGWYRCSLQGSIGCDIFHVDLCQLSTTPCIPRMFLQVNQGPKPGELWPAGLPSMRLTSLAPTAQSAQRPGPGNTGPVGHSAQSSWIRLQLHRWANDLGQVT